jgi:dTDP-4-dehydrorhamnose reductase
VRVLITGAGGQLGQDLVAAFDGPHRRDEVVAAGHARLDVGDRQAVLQAVSALRPAVIVHAAAWTAVDACEGDPDRAYRVNALGTRHIAEGARLAGAHVVYVSTDYVFDGRAEEPYREWDDPNPRSVYGRSKLGGERELFALLPGAAIVRTSWVFSVHGANMVKTILRLSAERNDLAFVHDQQGCPTSTEDLAGMILVLAAGRLPGLFHVTNQGATTWYEFARAVVAAAGRDPSMVRPIATSELRPTRPAPRPANSVLDNAALRLAGVPLLPDHHDPLERAVKHLMTL